jgi:hypothetical protein
VADNDVIEEELRQRFAMLHLAWDEAYWQRRKDPSLELRRYLHILGGITAIWRGVMESRHYHAVNPQFRLDGDLTTGICRCICDILINTHPKYKILESLAEELQEVAVELLELHVLYDTERSKFVTQSLENVIHVLNLKSTSGWQVADRAVTHYSTLLDHAIFDKEFQDLIDLIGPSLAYAEYTGSEDFDSIPDYWANDLYRDELSDQFEHMRCGMCWGPNSPEVVANEELRARADRKKQKKAEEI